MRCCSPMQRNIWTVQIPHEHNAKLECVAARRCEETSRLYRLTIGTPRNQNALLLADGHCTDSPQAQRANYMCCCSPMQRNVSIVQTHHRHTAKFYLCCCSPMHRNVSTVQTHCRHTTKSICDAVHRCKKTSRLYRFNIAFCAKLKCVGAPRCKETSRLYRFSTCCCSPMQKLYRLTMGTPRNLHVLLLADANKRLDCTHSP